MVIFVNDFVSHFHVFVDLNLIVCSIIIRNIKPNELPVKLMNFEVGSNKVLFLFMNTNKSASIQLFDYSQLKTKQGEVSNKSV